MKSDQALKGSANSEHSIDLTAALRRLRGDNQLLLELISFFLEDYEQAMASVHQAAKQKNREELSLASHSLKGLAANFDAHHVVETAGTIEQHAKAGDLVSATQLVAPLDAAVQQLAGNLRRYCETNAE